MLTEGMPYPGCTLAPNYKAVITDLRHNATFQGKTRTMPGPNFLKLN